MNGYSLEKRSRAVDGCPRVVDGPLEPYGDFSAYDEPTRQQASYRCRWSIDLTMPVRPKANASLVSEVVGNLIRDGDSHSMDSSHTDQRSTVQADIDTLHRELERLFAAQNPRVRDKQTAGELARAAVIIFRGK